MWFPNLGLSLVVAMTTIVSSMTVVPLHYASNSEATSADLVALGRRRINRINGVEILQERSNSEAITSYEYGYVANVSIGGNIQRLLVDTGASNTWCGYRTSCYDPGATDCGFSSCEPTKTGVLAGGNITFTQGNYHLFSAVEYLDTVSFAGLTVSKQSIGASYVARYYPSFIDGVLGLGPVELTKGTDPAFPTIPTFMDNLYSQGQISTQVLGMSLRLITGYGRVATTGELTIGGIDTTKFNGSLTYFPRAKTGTAAPYWGLDVASMHYGTTAISGMTQAIVDSGTTLIHIPTAAYNQFLTISKGQPGGGNLVFWYNRDNPVFANFTFTIGTTTITLTPDQYLVPLEQYQALALSSLGKYAWFADGGSTGVTTILGQRFLEQFYSVYDTTNSRIGLASLN